MTTILQREKWRIVSNYVRLVLGLAIGLTVTRLLIGIGEDVYGVYITITVGFGASVILTELLRMGLVPVLGVEIHEGNVVNRKQFREVLTAALAISTGFALIGALLMFLLGLWLLPQVGDVALTHAAWVFLIFRIAMMLVMVSLTPFTCVLLVAGRQPRYNFFLFLERLSELLAVIFPLWVLAGLSPNESDRLMQIGAGTAILTALTYLACTWNVLRLNPDYHPALCQPRRAIFGEILGRIGWSSLQTLSMNLYVRFDILLVAAVFGTSGALALGVAIRLMGFIRQATVGLANGLDSVFANLTGLSKRGGKIGVDGAAIQARLIEMSTSLQASLVFQGSILILLLRDDLVGLWIGGVLDPAGNGETLAQISDLSALMVLGIGARSLNLSWMSAMMGMGMAHRFTPWLVPAAVSNVVILISWYLVAPDSFTVVSVGWVFVAMQVLTHSILLPLIAAKVLQTPIGRLLRPMLVPLVLALFSVGLGVTTISLLEEQSMLVRNSAVVAVVLIATVAGFFHTWYRSRSA